MSQSLKIIAIILMIIDHIGFVFFPNIITYRIIGRLSFPIFAYLLTKGYHYTSNLREYQKRLLRLFVVSQIPYMILFKNIKPNIFLTLFLGLTMIDNYEKKKYVYLFFILIASQILKINYGFYGLLMILLFWVLRENKLGIIFSFALLNVFFISIKAINILQFYSVFSLIPILLCDYFPKINLNKKFLYYIYPIHLFILIYIRTF